jgi:hypothetical protein
MSTFTERINELTVGLDLAGTKGGLDLLELSDRQLFDGWSGHAGIDSDETVRKIEAIAERVRSIYTPETRFAIVLSGAGLQSSAHSH